MTSPRSPLQCIVRWLHRKVEPDYIDLREVCVWMAEKHPHETVFWFDDCGTAYEAFVAVLQVGPDIKSPHMKQIIASHAEQLGAVNKASNAAVSGPLARDDS